MQDAVHFHETGAKWFRLMRIVLAGAAVMSVLLGIFSVYHPRKTGWDGSDWSAFVAVAAIAGFFAASFGAFGLWFQWRKPQRFGVSSRGIVFGKGGTPVPWTIVDRVGFYWTGQRFRPLGQAPLEGRPSLARLPGMNGRLSLLVYVTDTVVVQRAARGIGGAWCHYWYRTPFKLDLAMIEARNEDVFRAIQMKAPRDVLARSGMLER